MPTTDYGQVLREQTTGSRVHVSKLGTRKALEREQVEEIAEHFKADDDSLSASKQLFDTRHPAWKRVKGILQAARSYWFAVTVPYVEPGIRLMRRSRTNEVEQHLESLKADLESAVDELQAARGEMLEAARQKHGDLFDESDFPRTFRGQFAIAWDYLDISPPAYLATLAPEVYERECQRIKASFDQAVVLAEQVMAEELSQVVSRLHARLQPGADGKRNALHESAVEGLREFVRRFRQLSVGSNAQLEEVVNQCEELMTGVDVTKLRESGELRHRVSGPLKEIGERLDGLIVRQPERRMRVRVDEQANVEEEVAA